MGRPVYRDLDLETLRAEYAPSLRVPSLPAVLDGWAERSARACDRLRPDRRSYGAHDDEWVWYVPGREPDSPLFVFVHGGYWRMLSADDGMILAEAAHDHGLAFASVNYTLCPNGPLPLLVDQVRRAVADLIDHADSLGHDPGRVHLAGHSAGGHLVATTAITERRLAGLVPVSGVFDLTPIVHTTVNDDVRMTADEAVAWSPAGHAPSVPSTDCVVTWGALESSEFARQSRDWAAEWTAVPGNRPARVVEAAARHHFDVLDDLLDADRPLGAAVLGSIFG